MNKYIAWLPALIVFGAVIYQPLKKANEVKTVDKTVSFAVYKGNMYTSGIYDNASARVHIIVEKVSSKGKRTPVWDRKLDAKLLKQYPVAGQAMYQEIVVHNVNERNEHLEVNYVLTYDSKGSELQMQDAVVVSGKNNSKVEISL